MINMQKVKIFKKISSTKMSNDALDAIAALTLIGVSVLGLIFWLSDMPY